MRIRPAGRADTGASWRPGFVLAVAVTVPTLALFVPPPTARSWVTLYDQPADRAAATLVRGDGQFFAMLAQDPLLKRPEVLRSSPPEYAYRALRPGYGWIAWAGSAGQSAAVPWVMVVITAGSAMLLAWSVAGLAQAMRLRGEVGTVAVLLPGALVLLAWTGPELLAAALACLATRWCIERRQDRAMAALVGAVLLRETLLAIVLALVLVGLLRWWRALVSALALVAWGLIVTVRVDLPAGSRYELLGLIRADWGLTNLAALGLLVALSALAWRTWPRLVVALLAVHAPLVLATIPAVWGVTAWTRVFLPVFALLLGLASPPASEGNGLRATSSSGPGSDPRQGWEVVRRQAAPRSSRGEVR